METQETKTKGTAATSSKLQARLDYLRKVRDEIKVKLHLGGMEAKDAFKKIEPAVDKAEHEVTHMAKDAAHAVSNAAGMTLDSLAKSLEKIRATMPK